MPDPVPTSRAAETGVRTVMPARVLAAGPAVGPYVDGRGDVVVGRAADPDQPPAVQARVHGQHVRHARVRDGLLQQEEPYERLQRRVSAGRPERGHGLAAGERRVRGRTEQFEEPVGGEGGPEQGLPEPGGDIGAV